MIQKYSRKGKSRRLYKKTYRRRHRGGLNGTKKFSKDKNTLFKDIVSKKHREEVEELERKIKKKNEENERLKREKKHLEKENKMLYSPSSSSSSKGKFKSISILETFDEGDEE